MFPNQTGPFTSAASMMNQQSSQLQPSFFSNPNKQQGQQIFGNQVGSANTFFSSNNPSQQIPTLQSANNLIKRNTPNNQLYGQSGNTSFFNNPQNMNKPIQNNNNNMFNTPNNQSFFGKSQNDFFNQQSTYGTQQQQQQSFGTTQIPWERTKIGKETSLGSSNPNIEMHAYSINYMQMYKKYSLDMLRCEDYTLIQNGNLPDNLKRFINQSFNSNGSSHLNNNNLIPNTDSNNNNFPFQQSNFLSNNNITSNGPSLFNAPNNNFINKPLGNSIFPQQQQMNIPFNSSSNSTSGPQLFGNNMNSNYNNNSFFNQGSTNNNDNNMFQTSNNNTRQNIFDSNRNIFNTTTNNNNNQQQSGTGTQSRYFLRSSANQTLPNNNLNSSFNNNTQQSISLFNGPNNNIINPNTTQSNGPSLFNTNTNNNNNTNFSVFNTNLQNPQQQQQQQQQFMSLNNLYNENSNGVTFLNGNQLQQQQYNNNNSGIFNNNMFPQNGFFNQNSQSFSQPQLLNNNNNNNMMNSQYFNPNPLQQQQSMFQQNNINNNKNMYPSIFQQNPLQQQQQYQFLNSNQQQQLLVPNQQFQYINNGYPLQQQQQQQQQQYPGLTYMNSNNNIDYNYTRTNRFSLFETKKDRKGELRFSLFSGDEDQKTNSSRMSSLEKYLSEPLSMNFSRRPKSSLSQEKLFGKLVSNGRSHNNINIGRSSQVFEEDTLYKKQQQRTRSNDPIDAYPEIFKNTLTNNNNNNNDELLQQQQQQNVKLKGRRSSPSTDELRNAIILTQTDEDAVILKIQIELSDGSIETKIIKVNQKILIGQLKSYLIDRISSLKFIKRESLEDLLVLIHKERVMFDNNKLKFYNVVNHDKLGLSIDWNRLRQLSTEKEQVKSIVITDNGSRIINKNQQVYTPKLTKIGYFTEPNIHELCNMTEDQLAKVNNFKIENQHGKIEFIQDVDLRYVDLDEDVWIEEKYAEVYPESRGRTKPPIGAKLNAPAKITLYKCYYPKKSLKKDDILKKQQALAKKLGYELLEYNIDTGEFKIFVKNFQ